MKQKLLLLLTLLVCAVSGAWADSYTCGFESSEGWSTEKISYFNYTTVGTGWGVIGDGSSSLLKYYLVSDGSRTDAQSLSARSQSAFYAVTPQLKKGTISFYAKHNGSGDKYVKVYKASFNGSSYSIEGDPLETWTSTNLTTSFAEKSFNLDKDGYVAFLLNGAIIDDFCASNGLVDASTPVPTSFFASVTYESATLSWTAGGDETDWQLYVTDDKDDDPDDHPSDYVDVSTTPSKTISLLAENTKYYAYVRANPDGETPSDWVSCEFTTYRQYPIPVGFSVTGFTGTTATFNWTNGDGTTATAWQLQYSTDENFLTIEDTKSFNSKPYTLTSLTEGTTYYARLRADYGESHYSEWSNKVTFVPTDAITINDSDNSSRQVPFHATYLSNSPCKGQIVIPAAKLLSIQDRQITKLTFFAKSTSVSWGAATFNVYVKESSLSVYPSSSPSYQNRGTNVLTNASLSVDAAGKMVVTFTTPFNYTKGNLMISFEQNTSGTNSGVEWYGLTNVYESYYIYNNGTTTYSARNYFAPKMSITSVPVSSAYVKIGATGYTTFASPWKLNLDALPDGLTAYYAATDAVDGSVVHFTPATGITPANMGLLLKGTAGSIYAIPTTTSDATFSATNLMKGVGPLETALAVDATSGYNNYVLVNNGGTPVFQSLVENGATIPGGRAYLQNGTFSGGARSLSIAFDEDETTGISVVRSKKDDVKGSIFDLQGRKVAQPTKGLYIINGRKVVK